MFRIYNEGTGGSRQVEADSPRQALLVALAEVAVAHGNLAVEGDGYEVRVVRPDGAVEVFSVWDESEVPA